MPIFSAGSGLRVNQLSGLHRSSSVPASPPLTRFAAALPNIETAPVNVLLVGDSVFEFQSESTEADRLVCRFRDAMQTHYSGSTKGAGYYPCGRLSSPQVYTYGAQGAAPGSLNSTYGLGAKCEVFHDNTEWCQIVQTCDRFRVLFTLGPGLGTAGIQLDGGSVTTFSTTGGDQNESGQAVYDSGNLGAAASHTIKVLGDTGVVVFEGVAFENGDHSSGIHTWEAANSGQKADYLTAGVTGTGHWHALQTAPPDLVVIEFLFNEQTQAIDPAVFRSNLALLKDTITSFAPGAAPSFLLLCMWGRGAPGWVDADNTPYRAAILGAAADIGCGVIDAYAEFGWIGDDPDGLTVDGAHPSDAGSLALATFMKDTIVTMAGS